ncbi:MAG: hypothetical protein ACI86H_002543, partial [bacterium]
MNTESKQLSGYLFYKMASDLKLHEELQFDKEDLPAVFGMDTSSAKQVALSFMNGYSSLETYPLIMQHFYMIYHLWLCLHQEDSTRASNLVKTKYWDIIKSAFEKKSQ